MAEDPKRLFVEMVARLSRETQVHMDERHQHFHMTDKLIIGFSLLLVVLAVFNVYYVYVLYDNLNGIVYNMDSMRTHLQKVEGNMEGITQDVGDFDRNMTQMDRINQNTLAIARTMPLVSQSMRQIGGEMRSIESDMGLLSAGMSNVDVRFGQMTGGVTGMRQNVQQISRPMGVMNSFMP